MARGLLLQVVVTTRKSPKIVLTKFVIYGRIVSHHISSRSRSRAIALFLQNYASSNTVRQESCSKRRDTSWMVHHHQRCKFCRFDSTDRGTHAICFQISRKPYQHLVSITNSLFPRSKNLLRSKRDKPGEMMTDFRSGTTSIVMAAQAEPSRVAFTFYHSKAKVSSSAITTLENDKFLSDGLQVLNVRLISISASSIVLYNSVVFQAGYG